MSAFSSLHHKTLLQAAFAEAATGNSEPLVGALADDVRWTIIASTAWSRTYEGKAAVLTELLGPLAAKFSQPVTVSAQRFVAEDDTVVVEGRIHNETKAGVAYPNRYCWVFVFRDGAVVDVTEYPDTQLLAEVLQNP